MRRRRFLQAGAGKEREGAWKFAVAAFASFLF
jgi:hypothetical protein